MSILFINACVRENSRTLELAKLYLENLNGTIKEVELQKEDILPLDRERLALRDKLLGDKNFDHPILRYARDFASAEHIVIAAPYWDLSFPSLLKIYLENITVTGITFRYINGIPQGLCSAKKLTYITTAGGPIAVDFGYTYVKTLAQAFYGIKDVVCYKAENLDIDAALTEENMKKARIIIRSDFSNTTEK